MQTLSYVLLSVNEQLYGRVVWHINIYFIALMGIPGASGELNSLLHLFHDGYFCNRNLPVVNSSCICRWGLNLHCLASHVLPPAEDLRGLESLSV